MSEESQLLHHGPCESCGSSDGNAVYDDGHTYCFVCEKYTHGEGAAPRTMEAKATRGLLDTTPTALSARRLREETCRKWGYGVGEYKGQVVQVATYKDEQGRPVAQKIRTRDKKFIILGDAKQMGLYGKWLCRDTGRMIVVTEGEIDALSVSQLQNLKYPVVSVPNGAQGAHKAIAADLSWLEQFQSVIFMFDNDAPGKAAAEKCAAMLTPGKAKIANLPADLKDPSEALVAGRGAEVIEAMWGAKVYRPDGVVDCTEMRAAVSQRNKVNAIAEYPYPRLQAMTRGLCPRQVVTITAGSGMGKTELSRELVYHFIQQGLKVGIVALEESVDRTALGLTGLAMDRRLYLEDDPESVPGFDKAWDAVITDKVFCYDHFGSMEGDTLISKLRYLRVACGVDVILLDHISIVVSGMDEGDERKTIDRIMTRIRSLAEETDAAIVVVSHLKRPQGTPHEEGGRTSLSQLRGSASIGQLSDICIGMERDQQDEEEGHITTLRILKNRRTGEVGIADEVEYVPETGRMRLREAFSVSTMVVPADY